MLLPEMKIPIPVEKLVAEKNAKLIPEWEVWSRLIRQQKKFLNPTTVKVAFRPGQAFETVEQTASMHNVDPELILAEINNEIDKESKPS